MVKIIYAVAVNGAVINNHDGFNRGLAAAFQAAMHQARHWKGGNPTRRVVIEQHEYQEKDVEHVDSNGRMYVIRSGYHRTWNDVEVTEGKRAADWESCGLPECTGSHHGSERV